MPPRQPLFCASRICSTLYSLETLLYRAAARFPGIRVISVIRGLIPLRPSIKMTADYADCAGRLRGSQISSFKFEISKSRY